MASFGPAVEKTLRWEGGLTTDTGGLTNYGISQNAYPALDIRRLTIDGAKAIYKRDYWDKVQGDKIADQKTAEALFDWAVNAGTGAAVKAAQRLLGFTGKAIDGGLGPNTLAAINRAGPSFSNTLTQARITFYENLAASNPAKYGIYLKGWKKRALAFFDIAAARAKGSAPALSAVLIVAGAIWLYKQRAKHDRPKRD
jgi:lysozyme family protein